MERADYKVTVVCINSDYGAGSYGREKLYVATIDETGEEFYIMTPLNLYVHFTNTYTADIIVSFEQIHRLLTTPAQPIRFAKDTFNLFSALPEIINGYPYMLNHISSVYDVDGNYIFVDTKYHHYYSLRDVSFALFGDFFFENGEGYHIDDIFNVNKISLFDTDKRGLLRDALSDNHIKRITPYEIYSNKVNLQV
ncbi:hypothetical protein HNP86_001780 [Methanococcus maripaludis]|uniref:Uncharacterized protein n=1 Tax=Methanococcus maripaludis TaxID=39152 RepID=A0A7J9NWD0_METMI|nr:hypothetical protein [Methanococcus maripaludis]MBA2851621.1 hypothetical protein [Methanococcus maripaludis]